MVGLKRRPVSLIDPEQLEKSRFLRPLAEREVSKLACPAASGTTAHLDKINLDRQRLRKNFGHYSVSRAKLLAEVNTYVNVIPLVRAQT